jgi:nicotinate-nucleotide adenylyltransferase
MNRIGILGGTFDPIHRGHLDAGRAAQEALQLTEVLVMTSNVPPHRPQPAASPFHRFAMVALAVAECGGWRASDLELRRDGPTYSSTTLRQLHELGYRAVDLFFIIGADAFAELSAWKDYPAILEQTNFAVVSRRGAEATAVPEGLRPRMARSPIEAASDRRGPLIFLIDAKTADVSSTAIRERCAGGESLAGLVPPGVQQHIERHGLYRSDIADAGGREDTSDRAAGRLHGQD